MGFSLIFPLPTSSLLSKESFHKSRSCYILPPSQRCFHLSILILTFVQPSSALHSVLEPVSFRYLHLVSSFSTLQTKGSFWNVTQFSTSSSLPILHTQRLGCLILHTLFISLFLHFIHLKLSAHVLSKSYLFSTLFYIPFSQASILVLSNRNIMQTTYVIFQQPYYKE